MPRGAVRIRARCRVWSERGQIGLGYLFIVLPNRIQLKSSLLLQQSSLVVNIIFVASNLHKGGALKEGGDRRKMDKARNFGFLLNEVSRRYVQRFEKRAQKMSLTLPTCKVLACLERNAGISQSRLAELANIEPMTVVRILDRMEAEGLVERRADPIDRRAHCLYLTLQARPALDEIWRLADQTRAETFLGVSQAKRTVFLDVLERLALNLRGLEVQSVDSDAQDVQAPTAGKSLSSVRRARPAVARTR